MRDKPSCIAQGGRFASPPSRCASHNVAKTPRLLSIDPEVSLGAATKPKRRQSTKKAPTNSAGAELLRRNPKNQQPDQKIEVAFVKVSSDIVPSGSGMEITKVVPEME